MRRVVEAAAESGERALPSRVVLVGRDTERARLRALLEQLEAGGSFALVVHGDAGAGKTTLLRETIERAADAGVRVVRRRGSEAAADQPWAGVAGLAAPLLRLVDRLPGVQSDALATALGLGDAPPAAAPDRFTVPVALLGLFAAAAEDRPLLVVADDLQWFDSGSRDALVFVARRLGAEGVGLLAAARDGEGWDAQASRLDTMRLGGLSLEEAATLLGAEVAAPVAADLHEAVGGNPLALLEVRDALSADQRAGRSPLPRPLPAGARVRDLFARRIADLPEATRRAVSVAALMDRPRPDAVAGALAVLAVDPAELFAAERAGVLVLEGGAVTFRHPLVRAAADAATPRDERKAIHRALADVAPDEPLRAWHLGRAASDPDEEVAAALERAAVDARTKGAPVEAMRAWERAADLSPDAVARRRRRLEASRDALLAGDTARALGDLAELEGDAAVDPATASQARQLAGVATMRQGRLAEGVALLDAEAERLAETAPVAAAQTLLLTTGGRFGSGDMEGVVRMARRARGLAGGDARTTALAKVVEGEGLVPQGEGTQGIALIDEGAALVSLAADDLTLVAMMGCARIWTEGYDAARALLDELILTARAAGAIPRLVFPLAVRADLERRRGRWHAAEADAAEATRLGRDAGIYAHLSFALATAARLSAARGDLEGARRDAAEVRALTGPAGSRGLEVHAFAALGLAELSAGDPAAALDPLRQAAELYRTMRWGEPSYPAFHGDLLEALVATGEADEARRTLDALAGDAERSPARWPAAVVAVGRGLLAADDAFGEHFDRALRLMGEAGQPFERARVELLLGERQRRAGRAPEATERLRSAAAAFEQLGARPWGDRARRELSGGTTAARPAPAADTFALTAQEWRVALLVAQGLTNREAGAALFVSPKTIEHTLTAIYKKVGVRSRTQLAKRVATEDARQIAPD